MDIFGVVKCQLLSKFRKLAEWIFLCHEVLFFTLFPVSEHKLEQEGQLPLSMRCSDKLKKAITEI